MKFLNDEHKKQLLHNGSDEQRDKDRPPVLKLFLPNTRAVWLLSELDPNAENIAFGLCDLGVGFPELGYVDLQELDDLKKAFPFEVECDSSFEAKYPMSVYTTAARMEQFITESAEILQKAETILAEEQQSKLNKNQPKQQ